MRIAIISKSDETGGGASRVAAVLADLLTERGEQATHLIGWSRDGGDRLHGSRLASSACLKLNALGRRIGFAETIPWETPFLLSRLAALSPDVVHFHDTSTTVSPSSVAAVARRYPTAWTFHDCSPFTGGCLYPQLHECTRYKENCGSCPGRGEWPIDGVLDTTPLALRLRRSVHRALDVAPIAPSAWMARLAAESGNLDRTVSVVSNSIETDVFVPAADKARLRRKLGIPQGSFVVLAGAGNVMDPRKGVLDSVAVARSLGGDVTLALLGNPDRRIGPYVEGMSVMASGYVRDRHELAEWYASADALAFCSKSDNQPLFVLEALSSGLPVFSLPTGGVPEMVDGECGGIAADVQEMIAMIESARQANALPLMSSRARKRAEERYSPALFATEHQRVYRDEIERRKSAR